MAENNPFIKNEIYPDASKIFSLQNLPLTKIKGECLYVIDTNALLLFYQSSANNLPALIEIFESLIERKRLFIPGQVAREFANNRPERIKELFQILNKRMNVIPEFPPSTASILNTLDSFSQLVELEEKYNSLTKAIRKQYKTQLDKVLSEIKGWTWNDLVSEFFRDTFVKSCIVDPTFDENEIKKELSRRYSHKIPPGYKDQSKADDGIGDLLIWFTILEIGKLHKKSVVFVSGDEKADWVTKSDGQVLCPRYELVYEFNQATEGKSFHVIRLSEFIELTSGSTKLFKEIQQLEKEFVDIDDFLKFEIARPLTPDESFPIRYTINKINHELDRFKKAITKFLQQQNPIKFGTDDILKDLTTLHRSRIITFSVYSRLLFLFSCYQNQKPFPDSQHYENLAELEKLKILTYEALAETDFNAIVFE